MVPYLGAHCPAHGEPDIVNESLKSVGISSPAGSWGGGSVALPTACELQIPSEVASKLSVVEAKSLI